MARHHYETLQQVFDDAYRGLAAQGFKQSRIEGVGCGYRGTNGLRCAVGHCITDEDYRPDFEGASARSLPVLLNMDGAVLTMLQRAHDLSPDPVDMKERLAAFAERNGLTIPSIEGAV